MSAPDWAHKLLDLAWGEPGGDPTMIEPGRPLHTYMPVGGFHMWQLSVPGAAFGAAFEYANETFGVDFRDNPAGEWTVAVQQPQPEPEPAKVMTLTEWEETR